MGTRIHDKHQRATHIGDHVNELGQLVVTALFWVAAAATSALLVTAGVLAIAHILTHH